MNMTYANAMTVPSDDEFRAEAARFLPICAAHCSCPNGWHYIWSAFKASGRRRSIYYQQPLLARLLSPALHKTRKVLIAGTADSGIVQVLASILGRQTDYLAIDRCAAPLQEIKNFAAIHNLSVRCRQVALEDYLPQEHFDLIFLHNTLGFLAPEAATRALRQLGQGLHEDGLVACGMRYYSDISQQTAADIAASCRSLFKASFAGRPDLMQMVDPYIDEYAIAQRSRTQNQYSPDTVKAMIKAAGYVTLDRCTDELTPSGVRSSLASTDRVDSEVLLLQPVAIP